MDEVECELQEAAGELATTLRLGRGLDAAMLDRLRCALKNAAQHWAGRQTITKSAANLFVDLSPSIDASSYLYQGEEANRIRLLADEIADLVRACVAVE
jgi:hypothetical protein